jgi:signal transduction histidine kinase
MFRKTLRNLTLLNSVVFLLIFLLFSGTLYAYVSNQLFDKVDASMRQKAESFRLVNGRPAPMMNPRAFFDPRVFILLRDANGSIINLYPFTTEDFNEIANYLSQAEYDKMQTQKIEEHYYRILSIPYRGGETRLSRQELGDRHIQEVIAVSIVDSELSLLRNFLQIILTGLIIGMLAIVLAGYYLAKRALIPIISAWDKQQQFVADASHELRTPLAVIKSNAELLLRHPDRTIEDESFRITNVVRESMRMSKLVSTLLTLARADTNQLELHFTPVAINDVITSIAEQFKPLAELKGIELEVTLCDTVELTADKERLQQLIVILLDNAIKYTPAGGNIKLSCRKQVNSVNLLIEDTGAGIAPQDLPRIFDRFYRGDKARSREQGGSGLGLAIAKWIVEAHGGKIKAESEVGVGTQFQLTLPFNKPKNK